MERPVFIDGLHPDVKWSHLKQYRDFLLAETDYTQVADNPMPKEKKAEFAEYRQKLRDIPQTFEDPDSVVFPEKPSI
ncbi:TPA: phage tail assembly chaperone [Aeromonas hydrophila subsp. hydrophila]|nr:phage tail assembly chaperone [Aeromonas hydrophila subsp. hydrophila]HEB5046864.1 phage tail assembly chaperone [Aeromonas hydrophila subsp. hydrophila]